MDAHEFGGTRINRMMENLLRGPIYQALVTPVDETPAAPDLERAKPLAERTIIHQIVKFCVVGATSFVIDAGLTYLFVKVLPWHGGLLSDTLGNWLRGAAPGIFKYAKTPDAAATPILTGAAALVAMFNSFVWNRSWTFEVRGKEEQLGQLRRFYAVSIIGFVMNDLITSGIYNRFRHMKNALLLGKFVAAFVVAVWNFIGQRFYAFRH
jgi:putative flippase GtrA